MSGGVYLALFDPHAVSIPEDHSLVPYGILRRVIADGFSLPSHSAESLWRNYSTESFYDDFERDYMNREVTAYFHFYKGKHLLISGFPEKGLKTINLASKIGYNNTMIHSDMAVFLTDIGYFDEALEELKMSLLHVCTGGVPGNPFQSTYFYRCPRKYYRF